MTSISKIHVFKHKAEFSALKYQPKVDLNSKAYNRVFNREFINLGEAIQPIGGAGVSVS